MGEPYHQEMGRLRDALNESSRREEAAEFIRGLIDCIVLRPERDGRKRVLTVDLAGHLAGILKLAAPRESAKGAGLPRISKPSWLRGRALHFVYRPGSK